MPTTTGAPSEDVSLQHSNGFFFHLFGQNFWVPCLLLQYNLCHASCEAWSTQGMNWIFIWKFQCKKEVKSSGNISHRLRFVAHRCCHTDTEVIFSHLVDGVITAILFCFYPSNGSNYIKTPLVRLAKRRCLNLKLLNHKLPQSKVIHKVLHILLVVQKFVPFRQKFNSI